MKRVEFVLEGDLRQLAAWRACARNACRDAWGPDADDEVAMLELALAEAVTNIVRHAFGGSAGQPIEMIIETDPARTEITLLHGGAGFDPEAVPPPDFGGGREGGFGLYLIRRAVDEVEYFQDHEGRHGVRLVKRRRIQQTRGTAMLTHEERIDDVVVVTLNIEQLDAGNADDVRQELDPVLGTTDKLALDLGRVRFVDSRGIGTILSILKQLRARGGDLRICSVARPVRTTFELVRLHRICPIDETRDDSIRAFSAP